jgi:ligand-binding sensor domain-containing protein
LYELKRREENSFTYQAYIPTDSIRSISGGQVEAVVEDMDKNLWIATSDNGLNVKKRGTNEFKSFRIENGLTTNNLKAIVMDRDGNLWISGNTGLSKLDIKGGTFTNYTSEDGLTSANFYGNACMRSSTGELFFGNSKGFNAFFPSDIKTTQSKPSIYLSDFRINNQLVQPGVRVLPGTFISPTSSAHS